MEKYRCVSRVRTGADSTPGARTGVPERADFSVLFVYVISLGNSYPCRVSRSRDAGGRGAPSAEPYAAV